MSVEKLPAKQGGSNEPPKPPASYMEMVQAAVTAGNMDLVDRLMTAQERWEAGQARKAFNAAISAAKAEMPVIEKNRTVSFGAGKTSYRHADLAQIDQTIRPVLGKFGLDYRFRTDVKDNKIIVTCLITHKEGHMEENSLPAPADNSGSKNPIQAIGSTVTYLERYTLMAALGLAASDDDDAQSVSNGNGSSVINDEQIDKLHRRIAEVGADITKFCKYFRVPTTMNLPAARFNEAMAMLERKAKK